MTPLLVTLLPTPQRRRLDHVDLAAPPERVWQTLAHADLERLPIVHLLRTLLARRGAAARPEPLRLSDFRSRPGQPGVQVLHEEAPARLLLGAIVVPQRSRLSWLHVAGVEAFGAFDDPGAVKIGWALELLARGKDDTRLMVEQRISATDAAAWRRFRWWSAGLGPLERLVQRRWFAALAREFGATELRQRAPSRPAHAAAAAHS
jgi:hypothetical protein